MPRPNIWSAMPVTNCTSEIKCWQNCFERIFVQNNLRSNGEVIFPASLFTRASSYRCSPVIWVIHFTCYHSRIQIIYEFRPSIWSWKYFFTTFSCSIKTPVLITPPFNSGSNFSNRGFINQEKVLTFRANCVKI